MYSIKNLQRNAWSKRGGGSGPPGPPPSVSPCLPMLIIPGLSLHCVSTGMGSHLPPVSVSVQVLVVGPEGMRPSSHWKVAIAPTVVPDTVVLVELGGNSGAPQSARQVRLCLTRMVKDTC